MIIIAATVLFIAALKIELRRDKKKREKGIDVKHKHKPWIRAVMLAPSMACFLSVTPAAWYFSVPIVAGMEAFLWWMLFDGFYNLGNNKDWWFNGDANGKTDDSRIDKVLRTWSDEFEKAIKISAAGLFVIAYVLTFII